MLRKNILNKAILLVLSAGTYVQAVSDSYRLMRLQQQQSNAINKIYQELDYLEKHYQKEFAALNLISPDSLINTIIDHANNKYWFLALSRYRRSLNKSIQTLSNFNQDDLITNSPALQAVLNRLACIKSNLKKIDLCLIKSPAFIADNKKHKTLVILGIVAASIVLTAVIIPMLVLSICIGTMPVISILMVEVILTATTAGVSPVLGSLIAKSLILTTASITTIVLLNKRLKELSVKKRFKYQI